MELCSFEGFGSLWFQDGGGSCARTALDIAAVDGDVRSEAKQLLSSWLQHEDEVAVIERRATGKSEWPEGNVPGLHHAKSRRPPPAPGGATSSTNTAGSCTPTRSSSRRASPSPSPRRSQSEVFTAVESRLRSLQRSASGDGSDGGPSQEDVDVALGLLAARRASVGNMSAPGTPTCARGVKRPDTSCTDRKEGGCAPRRAPNPALDPLLRMNARQQAIRSQRESRLREAAASGTGSGAVTANTSSQGSAGQPRAQSAEMRPQRQPRGRRLEALRPSTPTGIVTKSTSSTASGTAMQRPHGGELGLEDLSEPMLGVLPKPAAVHQAARSARESIPRTVPTAPLQRGGNVKEIQLACADITRQNKDLEEQVHVARDEIAREVQAYRELLTATQTRDRHATAMQTADEQLKKIQDQRAAVDNERRMAAVQRLGLALETARRRHELLAKRAVVSRMHEARGAIIAKARLAAAALRAAKLGRCARAWRSLTVAERVEREAAVHIEQRMREQRLAILSACHYEQRLCRRTWVGWRIFLRHARDERAQELLSDRARNFIEDQAELDREVHLQGKKQIKITPGAAVQSPNTSIGSEDRGASPLQGGVAGSRRSCTRALSQPRISSKGPAPSQAAAARRRSLPATTSPEGTQQHSPQHGTQPKCQRSSIAAKPATPSVGAAGADPIDLNNDLPGRRQEDEAGRTDQPVARPQVRRPRVVLEMEQRAEVRQRVREERRERYQQREEQRLAAEREAEEAQRLAQEQEKRQQLVERRERQRAEQFKKAERLVEQAQQRQKMRQAHEFWAQNRLADCWCALRQATIEAEELQLAAWFRYRQSLLFGTFIAWRRQQMRDAVAREASLHARLRLADLHARRCAFHTVLSVLRQLAKCEQEEAAAARHAVLQGAARRCVRSWHQVAAECSLQKRCIALRQYAKWLARQTLALWVLGAQQVRLDRDLELHKQALREKAFGWLREIDASSAKAC